MEIIDYLFLFFALLAAGATLGILATKNLIHAAFLLVVCLLSFSGIYVLFNAHLVAIVQLLVYAGGIVVLLAFGIMLTSRSKDGKVRSSSHLWIPAIILFAGMISVLGYYVARNDLSGVTDTNGKGQVEAIGVAFMTRHILAFELVAYLLLVVLVGASYFAKKSRL